MISRFLESMLLSASDVNMSRSNPLALAGLNSRTLEGFAPLEDPDEPFADSYLDRYLASDSGDATPIPSSSLSISHGWSDTTFTGSASGRCSTYSWGVDEGELDRAASETVRRLFDRINGALYEGKSTGTAQGDRECREWSTTFPHLEVQGIHLLDTMDDGTEMVAPDLFVSPRSSSETDPSTTSNGQSLTVVGHRIQPVALKETRGCEYLQEEVIASHGEIEEYFAYDNSDEDPIESRKRSRLRRPRGLPPVTPNACVRDAVCSLVFEQVWGELAAVLQPLVAAVREMEDKVVCSRSFSPDSQTSASTPSPLGLGQLQQQPYILRGLRDQPTLTKAIGQSGSQHLRFKHSVPSAVAPTVLPQISANLTGLRGVMQIRSVPLQQRLPSTMMAIPDLASREGTPSSFAPIGRPESSAVGSRLGNRLISSRLTSRRNLTTLRPIEKPKTPALVPIDDGIRGYRLYTNPSHGSPPTTPWVRNSMNTQLPPLEPIQAERSPPTRLRNRVTFSSRIVSAADSQPDTWRALPRPPGADLRPSTTTNTFRADGGKSLSRKGSEHGLHYGRMKIVGHAAGIHSSESFMKDSRDNTIAEDDEVVEEEAASNTIAGTSGFFQPKPRSSRTKLRGHIR